MPSSNDFSHIYFIKKNHFWLEGGYYFLVNLFYFHIPVDLLKLKYLVYRLSENRNSKVDQSNLYLIINVLKWLTTEDSLIACIFYTGKSEDMELHQELIIAAKGNLQS